MINPKIKAVFLVAPANIKGEHVQNEHVFDGHYYPNDKLWKIGNIPRCKKSTLQLQAAKSITKDTDFQKFCNSLVDRQFEGNQICGTCFATFFDDED
ncbi:hypothetical protein JCM14635_25740 [Megalodesulfovibrio paquesii]